MLSFQIQEVKIKKFLNFDDYGNKVFGEEETLKCRFEPTFNKLQQNATYHQKEPSILFTEFNLNDTLNSLIIYEEKEFLITSVKEHTNGRTGQKYWEVTCE